MNKATLLMTLPCHPCCPLRKRGNLVRMNTGAPHYHHPLGHAGHEEA